MAKTGLVNKPWTKDDIEYDRREVYIPLDETLDRLIKGIENYDIFIPLGKIARMIIHGKIDAPRHRALRQDLYHLLRLGQKYRKIFFAFRKGTRDHFDAIMRRYHWYDENDKEFILIKNSVFEAILLDERHDEWVSSFNTHLDRLSLKMELPPEKRPDPEKILARIKKKFSKKVQAMEKARGKFLSYAKFLHEHIKKARKKPSQGWKGYKEEWESMQKQTEKKGDR